VEWVPELLAHEELHAIACIADTTAGADTIQSSKTEINAVVDCIGARFDARSMEVAPTCALFLKLICLVFLEAPSPLRVGHLVRVSWLQRLSSYFILAADFIPPLRPFSRGAAHNTAGREAQRSVPLSATTIVDINFWQAVLLYSCSDATWLVQPVAIPPLFRELPGETPADRSTRQASSASLIIYSDACKDPRRRGLGFVITDQDNNLLLWGKHMLPPTSLVTADINVLECLAAVLALDAASSLTRPTAASTICHFHQFTDNSSTLSWLTTYRARSPLHAHLLQLYSHLQIQRRCVITRAHLSGILNCLADAASRDFDCPNGNHYSRTLCTVPCLTSLPRWMHDLDSFSMTDSSPTWANARASLMALVGESS
jgi:hypothetical protein